MDNVKGWLISEKFGHLITNKPRGFWGASYGLRRSARSDVEEILEEKHGLKMVIEMESNIKYLCDRGRV